MSPTLARERDGGFQECVSGRRDRPDVECLTVICQVVGGRLVVRCRNCHTDHVFVVRDGKITLSHSRARRAH